MAFIDAHRADFGSSPSALSCAAQIVAGGPEHQLRRQDLPTSAREQTPEMIPVLVKIWGHLRDLQPASCGKPPERAGHDIGRDQTARLMGTADIEGARRGKKVRTTRTGGPTPPDLVGRLHRHPPNQLWVVDLTFVATSWAEDGYGVPCRHPSRMGGLAGSSNAHRSGGSA